MSLYILIDILGWVGTILYLVAGALLVINTLYLRAYPSAGLNVAWIGIGMLTLGRRWLTRS
jgi:hypothetical protein